MAFKVLLGIIGVALGATIAVVTAQGTASKPTPKAAGKAVVAAMALPPLPNPGFAPARPMDVTRMAYEFAAKHPDVIKYVPCYCGCERSGHGSNESCFVRARTANGGVTWDEHGWGCTICIDVAVEAARMYSGGADVAAIRTAIDRKYASRFPTSTPTPKPPAAHKH